MLWHKDESHGLCKICKVELLNKTLRNLREKTRRKKQSTRIQEHTQGYNNTNKNQIRDKSVNWGVQSSQWSAVTLTHIPHLIYVKSLLILSLYQL